MTVKKRKDGQFVATIGNISAFSSDRKQAMILVVQAYLQSEIGL